MYNGGMRSGEDRDFINRSMKDGRNVLSENVIWRSVYAQTAADPITGVIPTPLFKSKKLKAVITILTPQEVTESAGIYQYGDLRMDLWEKLDHASDLTKDTGDRIIYQKTSYRIVGRGQNQNIEGRDMVYAYIIRKVGNT